MAVAVAFVVVIGLSMMPSPSGAEPATATVTRGTITYSTITGGQVVGVRANDLSFGRTAGAGAGGGARRVKEVEVGVGARVSAGDVLVQLDTDDADERVDKARDAVSQASGALRQAQEAARLQAEQAAKLREAAAQSAGQAQSAQQSAGAAIAQCTAQVSQLAATEAGEIVAVLAAPPPGLPPNPSFQQLLPYLPKTRAAMAALQACIGQSAGAAGGAGALQATAKMLEQQAESLGSRGAAGISGAQSRVSSANLQLRQAEASRDGLTLHAPYDGVITAVNVTKGSLLSATSPAISIRSPQLQARADLVEGDLLAVAPGASAVVRVATAGVEVSETVAALPKDPLPNVSGPPIFPVYFALPDAQSLRAGQTVRTRITVAARSDVLTVPTSAIGGRGADNFVMVATPGGDQRRAVTVGISSDSLSEIVTGLSEGETVKRVASA